MNSTLRENLILIANKYANKNDPSHDINHLIRILALAERIGKKEKADMDIIVPAALFHDIIVYKKNSPKSKNEAEESAELAKKVLTKIKEYPKVKIEKVELCIRQCSFSKGITPELIESKILQDADRLEATGAISIMRTFSSGGQMNRPFYPCEDPFCKNGTIKFRSNLDLFYDRLLIVEKGMHTKEAKKMGMGRTEFLKDFLKQLKVELRESGVL